MENTNRLILEKLSSNEMLLKISSKEENIKITSLFCSLPFMSQLSFDIGHDLIKGVIATMLMSDIKKKRKSTPLIIFCTSSSKEKSSLRTYNTENSLIL